MKDTGRIPQYEQWADWRVFKTIQDVRAQRPDLVGEVIKAAGGEKTAYTNPKETVLFIARSEHDRRFQDTIYQTKPTLEEHSAIASARFRYLQSVAHPATDFTLAIELCPLYLPGSLDKSQLDPNPTGIESVLASRVGKKWTATSHVIQTLAQQTRKNDVQLKVHATFGDKGVLVATDDEADERLLDTHSAIYQDSLQQLCDSQGVILDFHNLSEFPDPNNPAHRVGRFVVAEGAEQVQQIPPTEELMQRLGLPSYLLQTPADRKQASILGHALGNCGGNMNIWTGLLNTYIHYVPYSAAQGDMHLGIERADWLLAIQKFPKGSPLERKPALNIEVA